MNSFKQYAKNIIVGSAMLYCTHVHETESMHKAKNITATGLKEALQRGVDHLPFLQFRDLYHKKVLVSGIPIENNLQKRGRILQAIPQAGILGVLYFKGKYVVDDAKEQLHNILVEQVIPSGLHDETIVCIILLLLGSGIYYGITKPGDALVYRKKFLEKSKQTKEP